MAGHAYYTTEKLALIRDAAIMKQVSARLWELHNALKSDRIFDREPSGYTESKSREFDRIFAEAEMRGLV